MKLVWTPEARADRLAIWDHIAAVNPEAAVRMDKLFSAAAAGLARYPQLGRPGRIAGTRELVPHTHYCLIYEIRDAALWVLAVVHTARQWPPIVD